MGLISLKSVMSMEPKAGAADAPALGGVLCELLSQLPSSVSRRRGWKASSSSTCSSQHVLANQLRPVWTTVVV